VTDCGAWTGIFKPNWHNITTPYLQHFTADSNQILHNAKDHQVVFASGPSMHIRYPKWRTAAILKIS